MGGPPTLQEAPVSPVSSQPSGPLARVTWWMPLQERGPQAKGNVTGSSAPSLGPLEALRGTIGSGWMGLVDSGHLFLQAPPLHVAKHRPLLIRRSDCVLCLVHTLLLKPAFPGDSG